MTAHPAIQLIEQRVSANLFDSNHTLSNEEITELVRLATRAPTAYNLQNWRFIAVRTPDAKTRLQQLAYGQTKVSAAAVTFIICGQLPNHDTIPIRLQAFVAAGFMAADMANSWQQGARTQYAVPQTARDEAVRSATLGATTLIHVAAAMGFASSPMVGFDAEGVTCEFLLQHDEIPVMLVAVGRAAAGNWPQKPRRPLAEVLQIL